MAIVKITEEMVEQAIKNIDWAKMDAQTDEEIARNVASDPDAPPLLTEAQMVGLMARRVRKNLGLSQTDFAAKFKIPLGTLRDWEQARKHPDTTAFAYLRVIARNPDMVLEALGGPGA
jgi:putative transcriptional regulator